MTFNTTHINVRSLVPHFYDFKNFVSERDFTIIGVTETWLHSDILSDSISLENYTLERNDRHSRRGGGVGVYIGNGLKYENIFTESYDYLESIWLKVYLKKQVIIFAVIYRPPNTDSNLFINKFEDTLANMFSSYDNIICTGDFNIDMLKLDNNLTNQLLSIVEPFNLTQIITEPTRVANGGYSLLDLVFTNIQNITDKGVTDCNFSDHFSVYCSLNLDIECKKMEKIIYRSLKNIDFELFQRDLEAIPFHRIYSIPEIEEKIIFFNKNVLTLFDKHAPVKKLNKRKPYQPWITDNVKRMQKLRDKALRDFKTNRSPGKWDYYKQLRNLTNLAIKMERKAFYRYTFTNKSSKDKWRELNKLRPYKVNTIPDDLKNANDFNAFFINSTQNNEPLNNNILNFYSNNRKNAFNNLLSFYTVKNEDIINIIENIKTKAFGSDQLNITLIMLCCPFVVEYIKHIINQCISTSYFPIGWKEAVVSPLPKVSNPKELGQFRSISILPALSKILERILEQQIRSHINEYNILPPKQSGFRSGFSCATAMADVTDDIINARDNNEVTALVLLDYTKAFDFLNHTILISILHYVGFSNSAIDMIKSFVTDRTQCVKIDNTFSDSINVTTGVPQGSILGPLLFSIYTSNFHTCLKYCNYHFYADDTQLYHSFSTSDFVNANDKLNLDLNSLLKVSSDHRLKLNPSKSIVMLLGNKQNVNRLSNLLNVKIDNISLPIVQKAKSLGLVLDYQLTFTDHVSWLLKKAYCALKSIYPHRHYLEKNIKKELCDSLVLSHFNHCDNVYGPCLQNFDRGRIQKVQNSCIRFIFGIRRRDRVSHKIKEVLWLNMHNRRKLHFLCFCYKMLKFQSPPYLYNKITFRTDVYNLNLRRNTVKIPRHNTQFFKKGYSYNVAAHINSLPGNLNNYFTLSFQNFKNNIFKDIFESQ